MSCLMCITGSKSEEHRFTIPKDIPYFAICIPLGPLMTITGARD